MMYFSKVYPTGLNLVAGDLVIVNSAAVQMGLHHMGSMPPVEHCAMLLGVVCSSFQAELERRIPMHQSF